jgi:multimeric flavodoxin WrbA
MKFIIFNGSLKPDAESNTFTVCKMAQLAFEKLGHECEIITMRDLDYEGSTDDVNDELKPHIMKMFDVDGVIFATPIWWGTHSCHIQAMLERLDFIYSWAKDNKYQPFYNKVFGTLVSGGGDGFQHIHGVLYSAASNFGFTVPPQCNIESKAQGMDEIVQDDDTVNQVKNCTINMVTWAKILKEGNPTQDARHGSVDINEDLNEAISWQKLRQAGAVMPYLYDSPEARKKGIRPNPKEPNIITSVNLKEPRRPMDRLTPLTNMSPVAWQKYMDDWWRDNKNDPDAKEKVDQIRQAAADAKMPITEGKRIPRKKGQKAKSKKHSDLYTDEDPKGTIHGLGFKDDATARASITKIRKSGRSHAHKIQAAVAMEQRARAAGKTGPAAIYRKFINSMKKKTKAKNKK